MVSYEKSPRPASKKRGKATRFFLALALGIVLAKLILSVALAQNSPQRGSRQPNSQQPRRGPVLPPQAVPPSLRTFSPEELERQRFEEALRPCSRFRDSGLYRLAEHFRILRNSTGRCDQPLENEEREAFERMVRPYVRQLERRVTFYHWTMRGGRAREGLSRAPGVHEWINLPDSQTGIEGNPTYTGPVELRPMRQRNGQSVDVAANYFRRITENHFFFRPNLTNWMVGNGLYAAVDPVVSEQYGRGANGALLEIDVPPGEAFLDIRRGGQNFLIPEADLVTIGRLFRRAMACQSTNGFGGMEEMTAALRRRSISFNRFLELDLFRNELRRFSEANNISFAAYNWGSSYIGTCHNNGAVVFMDPELASRANFRVLTRNLAEDYSEEQGRAYRRTINFFNVMGGRWGGDATTRLFAEDAPRRADDIPPVAEEVFGCSAQFLSERPLATPPAAAPIPRDVAAELGISLTNASVAVDPNALPPPAAAPAPVPRAPSPMAPSPMSQRRP